MWSREGMICVRAELSIRSLTERALLYRQGAPPRTLFAFGCSLAVDRSHERLVVALTRGDAFGCDFVYAPEVLLSERYVYSSGVLFQVLAAFGTGNRDDVLTLVQKPRQCELTQHDAVLGGDLLDSLDQL